MTDIEPRRLDIEPARLDRQLARQGGRHRRFVPAQGPCPGWLSYASQRHIRAMAVDEGRGWLWLATWGGVLCWAPEERSVTRHTSEDGLPGNATRAITVDRDGVVWAAGHAAGLATLVPDGDAAWVHQEKLRGWQVLHLAPQPQSGVYAALRGLDGRCALGAIAAPGAQMRLLAQGGLPCRAIDALIVDGAGTIWIGNVWGAHHYLGDGAFESFALDGAQVRAGGRPWRRALAGDQ